MVSGYIQLRHIDVQPSLQFINGFEFDEVYPFTNIFWGPSPASYGSTLLGFVGSYKQIEEDWNEWLWKFSQLLSGLDAIEAHVRLKCVVGEYHWKLEPRSLFEGHISGDSMRGQVWGITQAPDPDFSIHPDWIEYFKGSYRLNEKTGEWYNQWPRLIERWSKPK